MRTTLWIVLAGLVWVIQLEGSGPGYSESSSGHFGNHGGGSVGTMAHGYGHGFGYHSGFWRGPHFGSRYSRSPYRPGFYLPGYYGYGYDSYVAPFPADGPMPEYVEDSQPYYTKAPVPTQKVDCRDSWTDKRNAGSLSGAMNRLLQIQCENGHANFPSEPTNPDESNNRVP
jgi:hypothetical protein